MIQGHITGKRQRLVLSGALALLLAAGTAGAGVAGDPSQWGAVAGDPSQWGLNRGTTTEDPMAALNFAKIETALNFTKVEYETTAAVGVERAGTRIGSSSGTREST